MTITRISQSPSNPSSPLDLLTARTYLTSALSQHLGLVGTSIPVDFLKLDLDHDHHQRNRDYIWIRVPRDDATALATALSSWVGNSEKESEAVAFRVLERGTFLGGMMGGDGRELFA